MSNFSELYNITQAELLKKLNKYCSEYSHSANFVRPILSIHTNSFAFSGILIRADQGSVLLELTDSNNRDSLSYINCSHIQAIVIKNSLALKEVLSGSYKIEQESLSSLQFQRETSVLQKNLEEKLATKLEVTFENTNSDGVINHNIHATFKDLAGLLTEVAQDDFGKQALAEINSVKFIHLTGGSLNINKSNKSLVVNADYSVLISKNQRQELYSMLNSIL